MKLRRMIAIPACAIAVGLSGCGEVTSGCPTETVAKVEEVESCTVAPGATVSVGVRLCPTCNQTGAQCDVDDSAALASQYIQLDPTVEACEDVSSCQTPTPVCQAAPLECAVRAPSQPGTYDLLVYDVQTDQLRSMGTLTVASGPSSCAFASAFSSGL
jgi:hypothetical protein